MKFFVFTFISIFFFSCNSKSNVEKEIEAIPMDFELVRFDKEFANASEANLSGLKSKYPIFFPQQFPDSIWIEKMNDTLQKDLEAEVIKQFPTEEKMEEDLLSLFQHIKYYFPQFNPPKVYTVISDVDYQNKVILADSLLVIALDTYLGSEHRFYEGIQKYISKGMNKSQMLPDVAAAYSHQLIAPPRQRSLLAQMVYYGKELYLKDLWLPEISDADKIGFMEEEIKWAKDNEIEMWRYFVENEILFSTDPKLPPRFINPAPFSKFYLEIDNESPGMMGRYLGWQIVRAFMENNSVTVQQLMTMEAREIFNESKYKPKK